MKAGKVSILHSHLHKRVHSVRLDWNVLHNSPVPLSDLGALCGTKAFRHGQPVVHQSHIFFFDQGKKKKKFLQPWKVPARFWLNLLWGLKWLKLLPTTIATGGAILKTVCLGLLCRHRKEWNWGPVVLLDCPAKKWWFVHLQWLALAFYTSRADQQHFEPFYRNSFIWQDCLFFFFL